jgi:hypothetical protein
MWIERIICVCAILILDCGLFAQTLTDTPPQLFHIQGIISDVYDDLAVVNGPQLIITFQSNKLIKQVDADHKGFYQTDLPIGLYTMTAEARQPPVYPLTKYIRQFQITSSASIILNAMLYEGRTSCDVVLVG